MVPRLSSTLSILFSLSSAAFGQLDMGARITAMGNTGATATGPWSINANPAGLGIVTRSTLALGYTSIMNLTELSTQSAILVVPLRQNRLGLSIQRYGFSAFNTLTAGFVYGKQFGNDFGLAVRLNYHQVSAEGYGSATGFTLDIGAQFLVSKEITIGGYISNPSRQKYPVELINYPIPSNYNIGLSWLPSERLLLAASLVKEHLLSTDFRLGLEYSPLHMLSLRGGISIKPLRHYAGFGFIHKTLDLAFAVTSDPYLGYRPQISAGYEW